MIAMTLDEIKEIVQGCPRVQRLLKERGWEVNWPTTVMKTALPTHPGDWVHIVASNGRGRTLENIIVDGELAVSEWVNGIIKYGRVCATLMTKKGMNTFSSIWDFKKRKMVIPWVASNTSASVEPIFRDAVGDGNTPTYCYLRPNGLAARIWRYSDGRELLNDENAGGGARFFNKGFEVLRFPIRYTNRSEDEQLSIFYDKNGEKIAEFTNGEREKIAFFESLMED